jgi:ABC-2 type transport system permease protein
MTSKSLFFNLMREDSKRRLWTSVLTFLAFFFSIPVAMAMMLSDLATAEPLAAARAYMLNQVKGLVGYNNVGIIVFIAMLSVIMGVTSFSYLHSRQKVDLYHGIPVRREKLFLANYFNGILIPAVCYAVNLLLGALIAALYGNPIGDVLGTAAAAYVFFMLHYAALYSVTVLAMILTGNILIGILGTGVLHFYFPILIAVIRSCYSTFFKHSYRSGFETFNFLVDKCSVFMLFVSNLSRFNSYLDIKSEILRLAVVLAVTVVITALSLLLYKKRESEAAGKAMAFKLSQPVIQIPVVILASLGGGLFFYSMGESLGKAIFGILCGMLLSHCIIEIIYHFEFRKLFTHKIQMFACAAVAAIVLSIFNFDLVGYDSYIPEADSIESVAISFPNMDTWVSYGSIEGEGRNLHWRYKDKNSYLFENVKLTDPEPVLALVRTAIGIDQNAGNEETESGDYYYYYFNVKYYLKNGKEVSRSYQMNTNTEQQEVLDLYTNEDYLHVVYPLYTQAPEDTVAVRFKQGDHTSMISRKSGETGEVTDRLLAVYKEEFANLSADTMKSETPIATIQFMTSAQENAYSKYLEDSLWNYGDIADRNFYPVYPSFTKTIELLRDNGADIELQPDLSSIVELAVNVYQFVEEDYSIEHYDRGYNERSYAYNDYIINEEEQIREVMTSAISEEYSDMNPLWGYEQGRIHLQATYKNGSRISYSISRSEIPEFLWQELQNLGW